MSTTEPTTVRRPSFVAVVLNYLSYLFLFAVCAVMLILAWPALQARISGTPAAPDAPPATAPVVQPARPAPPPVVQPVIVQSVPQGQAPQPITIPAPAPAVAPVDSAASVEEPAPAPRPIIIVLHSNPGHGAPIVTGSGACAVAAKGARRCGDK